MVLVEEEVRLADCVKETVENCVTTTGACVDPASDCDEVRVTTTTLAERDEVALLSVVCDVVEELVVGVAVPVVVADEEVGVDVELLESGWLLVLVPLCDV